MHIGVSKVYYYKNHLIENQLFGINNPSSKDFSKITGYIALSINVQGPSDEAQQLQLGTEKQIEEKPPLIPASIKKSYK